MHFYTGFSRKILRDALANVTWYSMSGQTIIGPCQMTVATIEHVEFPTELLFLQ